MKRLKKRKLFFRKGDLRNESWLEKIFQEFKDENHPIKSVIHFAGLKSIGESIIKPLEYWDNNINSTLCLLSVMSKFSCYKLIFSSSATVYKTNIKNKITEKDLLDTINPYGNTKFCIEKILEDIFKSDKKKWKIACLRYFNPCGAHHSGLIGEDPLINHLNIYPTLLKVIEKEIDKLPIYGSDWPTKDGTCIRDYIHVMDLAESHLASLMYISRNKPNFIHLNIGTGKGVSVLELIKTFSKVNKCIVPYYFTNRRQGDAAIVVADNKLAIKIIPWKPQRDLNDICRDTWSWFINNNKS